MVLLLLTGVCWVGYRVYTKADTRQIANYMKTHHEKKKQPSMPKKQKRNPKMNSSPDSELVPYLTVLQTLESLGNLLTGRETKSTTPANAVSLLQKYMFPDSENKKTARKDSSSVTGEIKSSLLDRFKEIQNDENGKMLLELFSPPSAPDVKTKNHSHHSRN